MLFYIEPRVISLKRNLRIHVNFNKKQIENLKYTQINEKHFRCFSTLSYMYVFISEVISVFT